MKKFLKVKNTRIEINRIVDYNTLDIVKKNEETYKIVIKCSNEDLLTANYETKEERDKVLEKLDKQFEIIDIEE